MADKKEKKQIVIYEDKQGRVRLEIALDEDTLWLSRNQIAELFGVKVPAISKHISNIYKEGELERDPTVSILETVQKEGSRTVKREIEYYNLDMIISVGYRVNSRSATNFRIWATKTLKDHILKGYTINESRLKDSQAKLTELERALKLLNEAKSNKLLSQSEAEGLLSVISGYAQSWILLQRYDEGELERTGKKKKAKRLTYEEIRPAIDSLKNTLLKKKQATDIFAQERDGAFQGILESIYQSFGGEEVYPTVEEKAAHLLYFVIKNHPFVDGNKRTASFLFILFLQRNNALYRKNGEAKINDNALVALALLVAESKPADKDIMIALITHLLV